MRISIEEIVWDCCIRIVLVLFMHATFSCVTTQSIRDTFFVYTCQEV